MKEHPYERLWETGKEKQTKYASIGLKTNMAFYTQTALGKVKRHLSTAQHPRSEGLTCPLLGFFVHPVAIWHRQIRTKRHSLCRTRLHSHGAQTHLLTHMRSYSRAHLSAGFALCT